MTRRAWGAALAAVFLSEAEAARNVLINAAGATFPYPMYSKWFDRYNKKFPHLQFNYQSIGSGGGIKQITVGTVDFGASDGPMTDRQIRDFQQKRGANILHFPTLIGADVIPYNLPGISAKLNFAPETIAGIFLGKIVTWNDRELVDANPGVNLPNERIVVVHRSDGSGTTFVFVDYLCKVSKEWEARVGRGTSVNWPVGIGGKGNEGVAGQINQTPYSIGYTELVYALQSNMTHARIRNSSGVFVEANLHTVSEAASAPMPDDFRVSITNPPGKDAYPIASFTWLLIPETIPDPTIREAVKGFLRWMLDEGQAMTEALQFAHLPPSVIARERIAIERIH
ncbi:MAG: phosphate ABC transporter substrate-binding protein PstS [Bryobacteraceae bacterium]